jgi:peptide/nickel transport system substrate-binding protein
MFAMGRDNRAVTRRSGGGPRRRSRGLVLLVGTLVCLGLLATACSADGPTEGTTSRKGVKGGTLRVLAVADADSLDPAAARSTLAWALMRLYARTLYSWDSAVVGDAIATPVPDLASGPPAISDDGLTYTIKLRRGVAWAQPLAGEVRADDFIYAVERQIRGKRDPLNPYAWMIKGTREYASGKARTISGLTAPNPLTVRITLTQPAPDFLSILSLPFFAPVPRVHAAKSSVGDGYSRRVVGSGPYTLKAYAAGKSIVLVRNANWDPRTDPLRKAWVDKVEVTIGNDQGQIQRAIEAHEADLAGDATPPPITELQRVATDPRLAGQFGVKPTGCIRYLSLQTDAGPTADPRVRQAVNLAVNKETVQDALGGRFAGDLASTVLVPAVTGYVRFDQYPSVNAKGNIDRARQLLREAGYPNGVTLNYVGGADGQEPALNDAIEKALARAGIKLNVKAYPGDERYQRSLRRPDKKAEHLLGSAEWCADWPGDSGRSFVPTLLDGRSIGKTTNDNYGDYSSKPVEQLIDKALAEQDPDRRAAIWGDADRQAMADAAWAPLLYERRTFFWSYRVKNWTYSPWIAGPDYANLWLDPYTP